MVGFGVGFGMRNFVRIEAFYQGFAVDWLGKTYA
jgi:hypothetical protein